MERDIPLEVLRVVTGGCNSEREESDKEGELSQKKKLLSEFDEGLLGDFSASCLRISRFDC